MTELTSNDFTLSGMSSTPVPGKVVTTIYDFDLESEPDVVEVDASEVSAERAERGITEREKKN